MRKGGGAYGRKGACVLPCADGTFTLLRGLSAQEQCEECPPGYWCNSGQRFTCGHGFYTNVTAPAHERLSRHFVHGIKTTKGTKVKGYKNSSGNKRFNLTNLKWKNVTNNSYVKNEVTLRSKKAKPLPKKIDKRRTLYGHKPRRNKWVANAIINRAAAIPFVGLKRNRNGKNIR